MTGEPRPKSWSEMTRDEQRAFAADKAWRECEAQGLEFEVTDPVVLDRIATLASPSLAQCLGDQEAAS